MGESWMGELRKVFADTIIISSNNMLVSGINFITFLVLINALGTFGFGLYTLALSVLSFATFFVEGGLNKVIVSDSAKLISKNGEGSARRLFSTYAIFLLAAAFSIAGVVFAFSQPIAQYFNADIAHLIRLVCALIFLSAVKNIYSASFEIFSEFGKVALLRFFDAASKLALAFIAVTFFEASVANILASIIVSEILLVIFYLFFLRPRLGELLSLEKLGNWENWEIFGVLRAHGKWGILLAQARSLESNAIFWIIEYIMGVSAVGIFSALLKIQTIMIRLFEPLETIFYPLVSRFGNRDSGKIIFRAAKYTLYFSAPIVLGLIVFAEPFLGAFLGPEFAVHANSFRALMLVVFLVIINTPMKPLFFGIKSQKDLFLISMALLMVSVSTGIGFTLYAGLMGMSINRVLVPIVDLYLKARSLRSKNEFDIDLRGLLWPDKEDIAVLKKIIAGPKMLIAK